VLDFDYFAMARQLRLGKFCAYAITFVSKNWQESVAAEETRIRFLKRYMELRPGATLQRFGVYEALQFALRAMAFMWAQHSDGADRRDDARVRLRAPEEPPARLGPKAKSPKIRLARVSAIPFTTFTHPAGGSGSPSDSAAGHANSFLGRWFGSRARAGRGAKSVLSAHRARTCPRPSRLRSQPPTSPWIRARTTMAPAQISKPDPARRLLRRRRTQPLRLPRPRRPDPQPEAARHRRGVTSRRLINRDGPPTPRGPHVERMPLQRGAQQCRPHGGPGLYLTHQRTNVDLNWASATRRVRTSATGPVASTTRSSTPCS